MLNFRMINPDEPSHDNIIDKHADDYWGNGKARSAEIMVEI
ncbi:MAG: hypothetical protein ACOC2E_08870 [Bacteroidota bacterium]